jgi:hypothetical protein
MNVQWTSNEAADMGRRRRKLQASPSGPVDKIRSGGDLIGGAHRAVVSWTDWQVIGIRSRKALWLPSETIALPGLPDDKLALLDIKNIRYHDHETLSARLRRPQACRQNHLSLHSAKSAAPARQASAKSSVSALV